MENGAREAKATVLRAIPARTGESWEDAVDGMLQLWWVLRGAPGLWLGDLRSFRTEAPWGPRMGRLSAGMAGQRSGRETLANILNTGGPTSKLQACLLVYPEKKHEGCYTSIQPCVLVGLLRRMLSFYTFLISVLK